MGNLKILTVGTVVTIAFYSQALAICPSGQTEDRTTGHCMKTGYDCDGKCTWYFDTVTQDLVIKPNPGATGDLTVSNEYGHDYGKAYINAEIKNVTIAEGITGLNTKALNNWTNPIGRGYTLALPNSLTQIIKVQKDDLHFSTVIMSTENLQSMNSMGLRSIKELVLIPSEGKTLPANFFGRSNGNYGINIICKGDIELCQQMVAEAKATEEEKGITFAYEQQDAGGNTIAKYDGNGNLTAAYTYKSDGSIEIYDGNHKLIGLKNAKYITPAQAAALVKKGNNNTVKFTFK